MPRQGGVEGVAPLHNPQGGGGKGEGLGQGPGMAVKGGVGHPRPGQEGENHLLQHPLVVHVATRPGEPGGGAQGGGEEEVVHVEHRAAQRRPQTGGQGALPRAAPPVYPHKGGGGQGGEGVQQGRQLPGGERDGRGQAR